MAVTRERNLCGDSIFAYLKHPAGIAFTGMNTRRYHDTLARTKRFRITCKRCDREKIAVVPRQRLT